MGGILAKPPIQLDKTTGEPLTHVPTARKFSGSVAIGGFSPQHDTMMKLRTRSDFCLLKIFEEQVVIRAFELWCCEDPSTQAGYRYLLFIQGINAMKLITDAKEKRRKMFTILSSFISKGGKQAILLDGATRETITLGFENKAADEAIFDLSYEKAYQCLKFDYMPRFLISDRFMKLENGTRERRGSSSNVIDMSSILSETKMQDVLKEWMEGKAESKAEGAQAVDWPCMLSHLKLWQRLSVWKQSPAADPTSAASEKEIQNIRDTVVDLQLDAKLHLPKGLEQAVLENFNGQSSKTQLGVVNQLQNFLADILHSKVQKPFLKTSQYDTFVKNAPEDYMLDSTIMHLATFKDDRQLRETKDDYVGALAQAMDFENIFHDTILSAYFRRYLRLTFCEENYFFLKEVRDLKGKNPLKKRSWMDEKRVLQYKENKSLSKEDILKQKVLSISEHYVVDGRKYEVNIPHKVKTNIIEEIEAGRFCDKLFEKAEIEIMRILRMDSFARFKKHYIWEHLKHAFFVKFSQRNFVVGETIKGEAERRKSSEIVSGGWNPRSTSMLHAKGGALLASGSEKQMDNSGD